MRIHAYYQRAGRVLGLDVIPPKPVARRTIVIVPVNRISRLTEHALSEAVSLGQEVVAVTVVLRTGDDAVHWVDSLQHEWQADGTRACRSRSCAPTTPRWSTRS